MVRLVVVVVDVVVVVVGVMPIIMGEGEGEGDLLLCRGVDLLEVLDSMLNVGVAGMAALLEVGVSVRTVWSKDCSLSDRLKVAGEAVPLDVIGDAIVVVAPVDEPEAGEWR